MPSRSRRTVTRSPTLPSQAHSPPGRPSGWVRASRLTIVTSVPGATRSTFGLKHSSVRARVVPRPSVAGRWQPPPAAAGGAAASAAAARTAGSRTSAWRLRRCMAVSRVGDASPLLHRAAGPGSPGLVLGLGPGAAGGHGDLQRHPELVDVLHLAADQLGQPLALAGGDLEHPR